MGDAERPSPTTLGAAPTVAGMPAPKSGDQALVQGYKDDDEAHRVYVVGGSSPDPTQGALTDRSGTIAVGGTSQEMAAANAARRYLFVENVSAADLWIDFGSDAEASQPSILIPTRAAFVMEGSFISTQAVNIIGATTGQAFTAKEA